MFIFDSVLCFEKNCCLKFGLKLPSYFPLLWLEKISASAKSDTNVLGVGRTIINKGKEKLPYTAVTMKTLGKHMI